MLYEERIIESLEKIEPSFVYVLADQNGVELAAPYVLVSILTSSKVGGANNNNVADNGQEIVQQDMRVVYRLTLHAFANDPAQDVFETMWCGLEGNAYMYELGQQGLSLVSVGDLVYTSAPVDSLTYKRANMDLTVYTNRINKFNVPELVQAEAHGKVVDEYDTELNVDVVVHK